MRVTELHAAAEPAEDDPADDRAADPTPLAGETVGAAFARSVRAVYDLGPHEESQLGTVARMMDETDRLEREITETTEPFTSVGNRGATIASPRWALLLRMRREVRAAIAALRLPEPGEDDSPESRSDLGRRLARARWAGTS